ncbi:uncharacterized protein [Typha angustifolia]|uniref:uncharacterized protein n=1 Tax=Typha angustifolia TaxID=59011 RepID=UPI003C2EBC87
MHDSICSFYDALCGDINLYLSRGSYSEQAPPSASKFPEPSSGSSSSMVGEGHGFTGETIGAWGSSVWEAEGGSSSSSMREANVDSVIRFLPQTTNTMQVANDGASQFLSQMNNATQASHSPPSVGKRSWLAIQRERTANMGLSELASYLHLPMTEAAKELKLCSTALKHVCRRNGMPRWPSRQINAIDRQITRLQGELVRGSRRGGLFAIKDEIERLQARRARLYEGLES